VPPVPARPAAVVVTPVLPVESVPRVGKVDRLPCAVVVSRLVRSGMDSLRGGVK
jgi:hypothetical protein